MSEKARHKREERCSSTLSLATQRRGKRGRKTPADSSKHLSTQSRSDSLLSQQFIVLTKSTFCQYQKRVWRSARLNNSTLRRLDVKATTVFLNCESLVSSRCFSSTHYLDVPRKSDQSSDLTDCFSLLITDRPKGGFNAGEMYPHVSKYQKFSSFPSMYLLRAAESRQSRTNFPFFHVRLNFCSIFLYKLCYYRNVKYFIVRQRLYDILCKFLLQLTSSFNNKAETQ